MPSSFLSMYTPGYIVTLVYMLQSTEYQSLPYLRWYWRTVDFNSVMYRRTIDKTRAAKLLLNVIRVGILAQIMVSAYFVILGAAHQAPDLYLVAAAVFISYPLVWGHLVLLPLIAGRLLIIGPRERRLITQSKTIFANHPGLKIAIAGSYGKTSMKELLLTVLSEGKQVAATPANKNVASSHAVFAAKLTGQEDILIIEYGEGRPGDVKRFADTTQPNVGVITGLAPAHLDHYPTLEAAGQDIFSLAEYLKGQEVYVNGQSPAVQAFIKPGFHLYNSGGVLGWDVKNVKLGYEQTSFDLKKGQQSLSLHSGLIGKHQIGPLALAAALALKLGLSAKQVKDGIAKTKPYEHRMQPRHLHGAWIIDDTYNGTIDGLEAGLELLHDLPARHKTYVTPGLVDQGVENESVHVRLGNLIAKAKPDRVVLMKNSVTEFITRGLNSSGYKGELRIEANPLKFYANIDQFVASGDLVVMQNDWTDNYN